MSVLTRGRHANRTLRDREGRRKGEREREVGERGREGGRERERERRESTSLEHKQNLQEIGLGDNQV